MYAGMNYSVLIDFVDEEIFEPCIVKVKLTHTDNKKIKFTARKQIYELDNTVNSIEFMVNIYSWIIYPYWSVKLNNFNFFSHQAAL